MIGNPERLREWAAHWASDGHSPDSGLLLAREIWAIAPGQTEWWELRLADLTALLARLDAAEAVVARIPADRLNPWHTVTVHGSGWHMAHPIDCVLAECPFDGLAQAEWSESPAGEGSWRWHNFDDPPWAWEEDN